MRHWIGMIEGQRTAIAESELYPNVREIAGGSRFIVYHGSPSATPFDTFDAQHINSTTGKSHNAFFFSDSPDTAMSYLRTEEQLKPSAQANYDKWMDIFDQGEAKLLTKLNAVLAQHETPGMAKYNSISVSLLRLRTRDAELQQALDEIDREHRQFARYRNLALDLSDREANLQVIHSGVLYKCEITLHRPWERDMDGGAFQVDRWRDIFSNATQSGADGVILTNCMDSAADFGALDTIYAVFEHHQIKILSHETINQAAD